MLGGMVQEDGLNMWRGGLYLLGGREGQA